MAKNYNASENSTNKNSYGSNKNAYAENASGKNQSNKNSGNKNASGKNTTNRNAKNAYESDRNAYDSAKQLRMEKQRFGFRCFSVFSVAIWFLKKICGTSALLDKRQPKNVI